MSGASVACSGSVRYHDEEYTPSGAYMPPQGMARGMKKPGMPPMYVDRLAYQWFAQGPTIGSTHPPSRTLSQNSCRRGRRFSVSFPAMIEIGRASCRERV